MERKKERKRWIIIIFLATVVALMIISVIFNELNEDKHMIAGTVEEYAEEQNYDDLEENAEISIPGYESFAFKANQAIQDIILYNPKQNTCYFEISLILEDGTEIWKSDLLKPGMSYTSIQLNKNLKEGTYNNVRVKYECYSLKNLEKLNGADVKVMIIVE